VGSSSYPYGTRVERPLVELNKGVIFENLTGMMYNFRPIAKVDRNAPDTKSSNVSYKLYYK